MPVTARRPRRTNAQLTTDIHAAVRSALQDNGYRGITYEDVARRARVSKPVLYRRFSDRPAMVLDALHELLESGEATPPPDDGTLRGALISWFTRARDRATAIGADTYRGLIGEADPTALATIAGFTDEIAALLQREIVAPAVARGELGPTPLPERILWAPVQLLRDRIIFDLPDLDIPGLVDTVALPLYQAATGASSD